MSSQTSRLAPGDNALVRLRAERAARRSRARCVSQTPEAAKGNCYCAPVSTESSTRGIVAASVLTTVSSVYPAFLAGALGPELRSQLSIGERSFGLVVGSFFFGSAVGSVLLGNLGERLGPRRMIVSSMTTIIVTCLSIASLVRSVPWLIVALAISGVANAGGQTAANKLLGQSIDPGRLGLAMAIKQSGMPAASMLGGLAVPVIALTIGWQWGYVAAAVLASIAMTAVLRFAPVLAPVAASTPARGAALVSSRRILVIAAIGAGFSSTAAGTLGNWFTSSAVDAGWSTGAAGLLLSCAAVSGITVRLVLGWRADRTTGMPLRTASLCLALGSLGALALAPRSEWSHVLAVLVAFGAGWSWPGLFNYGIVRTNLAAASSATGVTQTGVYVGVFVGPILMGFLVDRWGYGVGWTVIATSMALGATIIASIAPHFTDDAASR